MSGDAARDDARMDVLDRRQGQMLGRRDVAEEVRAGDGSERAADSCRDVVVARRDIRDERSEHVERRMAAEALLELHVRLDLVVRHVARSLDHDLDAALPGAVHELAERDELRELAAVRRVGRAAGAHAVAEADGHIVLLADVEDVVIVLVERVLHLVVQHPARDEGAAAAHDVHDAALAAHALDGAARDAAVKRHEVRAVFCLLLDRLEDVVIRHLDDGAVLADGAHRRLIERHRADHDRRMLDDALARDVDVVARREVHDGISAAAHGLIELLELRLDVRERARRADVRVDLDAQALADAARAQVLVVDVGADGNRAVCHALADGLNGDTLLLCYDLHRIGDAALTGLLHLCRHEIYLLKNKSRPAYRTARYALSLPYAGLNPTGSKGRNTPLSQRLP